METTPVAAPTNAPRPARRRVRAIGTTIGVVLAGIVLELLTGFILIFLPIVLINSGVFGTQIYISSNYLTELLLPVIAAALGSMYWLALRGLQYNRVRVVWLQVTGLGVVFLLVTSVFTNMLDIVISRIFFPNSYFAVAFRLSTMTQAILQNPQLALIPIVIAMLSAIVIVNIARLFTTRSTIDTTFAQKRGWRDFATIWILTSFITCACSFSQVLFLNFYATTGFIQPATLPTYITLIVLLYFVIPVGIVATIACADALRALQNPLVAMIPPPPEDPFASSDGSFTLSISPIVENE